MSGNATILICLAICAGLFIYSYLSQKKVKDKHESQYAASVPGTRVISVGGLIGTVVTRLDDTLIIDCSPDGTGSLIELEKDGFYEILSDDKEMAR